ncbi:long-chain acyl-CoA synthetase [Panacagrimonas perspica]|uniref:Long-chain acyl-CoA synthetase n=1 Tax=Panacagrimonas perspica TaxID=381431 RepID=A0A4R7PBB8_9GAMM|nr:AMP-binding protein [Panacagrimonas perspica]TDU30889.1 long-chain acyl-CoA synthetase [Panacagrimonas perspica]THD01954.1 acyl-CoA synthetase [Panacagrimonas perspica]
MTTTRPWTALYSRGHAADITIEHPHALSLFRAAVARAADKPAIHYFDATLSYAEVDALSDALACALIEGGVRRGDRVAMYLQNVPQFVIGLVASWKAGAIAVSINPMNRERELGLLLADSQPAAILAHESAYRDVLGKVLQEHPVPTVITTSELEFQTRGDARLFASSAHDRPVTTIDFMECIDRHRGEKPPAVEYDGNDVAMLVYTSGTTGLPKGAMNSHRSVAFTAQVYRDWMGLPEGAGVLGIAPLFHITGLIGHIALSLLIAGPLTLAYRFEPGVVLDAIAEHRPVFTIGAITALIALMNHPAATPQILGSLKTIYSGGAPIAPAVVEQFESKFGIYIRNAYGLTETTSPSTVTPKDLRGPVDPDFGALSVGVPTFNTEIRIVDVETAQPVKSGESGEIVIRGPQVVGGYWNKPKETAEAIRDGWLHTGDIGVLDAAGWLYLVDRKKDMINASGYKVWPREVEDVLYTHPAVREAAVVGIPDEYRGESVKAVVSLKPGTSATAEEITEFCKARMAAYKYPRVVQFLPELPKTVTGKILRRELR